ncbi:MAG TPA: aminotransferase class V-fold PLP-dependent enzyme [Candidatus Angelobacter sp.]|jgi:glutamate/tyrosine decarboxylase-like PLP-dependent enzyme|nr:aminotransferase class V-fold PLP-dependent enzyme [Candidatus Angelobacter sp.]
MPFDFDSETRRQLGYKLIDRIDEYFSGLAQRPVQLPEELRTFADLGEPLPELGADAATVLDNVCLEMMAQGFHVPSANYFGLMNPTPTYMAVLAEALVAALNPQLASLARSQLAARIERETVRWIGERVGWDKPFDGTFTSGGNEANFSALAMALAMRFPQSVEYGLASYGVKPVLYTSAEAHHSLDKSASLLGLGRKSVRRIQVNAAAQMDTAELKKQIKEDKEAGFAPFCVVATAGTTNSGAIDDLVKLAEMAKQHGLWLHVDGAYGAAAIFSDQHCELVRGIELADSVTIDPHKWLAMPFAAGVVLTSHPEALQQAFATSTPYMPQKTAPASGSAPVLDNFQVSTQWSRRMNSLKLWLTLQVHGRHAYEELIDRQLKLAAFFANWVRSSELFELAVPQVLPILNFRIKRVGMTDDERRAAHEAIVHEVTHDGRRWISTTLVGGKSVIRMMVISYLTAHRHLEDLMIAVTEAAKKYAGAN